MNITDYIDTPGVPGLPEVPDMDSLMGPGITDFESFSLFVACTEKQAIFTAKALKLQSIILTARLMISKIRAVMGPMIGKDQSVFQIPEINGDFNIDMGIGRITSPKVNDLPKCLSDTITNKVSTAGANGMKDILDPFNAGIESINSITSEATPMINSIAHTFVNSVDEGIAEVNKFLKKTLGNIVSKGDKPLFELLDEFQKFVNDTNFVDNYREWKDIYKCLDTNCKPLEKYLYDDEFLFYDEEKKNFIMPIDISTGRIRLRKFFEYLTRDEEKQCAVIETRYFKYLADKKQILLTASKTVKDKGIKDDKNPFLHVAMAQKIDITDTFNNLF